MKVRCIKSPCNNADPNKPNVTSIVVEGNIYTVVDDDCRTCSGLPAYELAEHLGCVYAKRIFVEVPDQYIDITASLASQVTVGDTCDSPIKHTVTSN